MNTAERGNDDYGCVRPIDNEQRTAAIRARLKEIRPNFLQMLLDAGQIPVSMDDTGAIWRTNPDGSQTRLSN